MMGTQVKIGLIFLWFFCLSLTTKDQNKEVAKSLLVKMNDKLINASSLSMEYTFEFVNTNNRTEESYAGFYHRKGNMVHSMQIGSEIIQNNSIRVAIDSASRSIILTKPENQIINKNLDFSKSLEICSQVQVKDSIGMKILIMDFKAAKYPLSKLQIFIRNSVPIKVIMHHSRTNDSNEENINATIIDYKSVKINKSINNSEFNTGTVISSKNGGFVLTPLYQKYKLYNLM